MEHRWLVLLLLTLLTTPASASRRMPLGMVDVWYAANEDAPLSVAAPGLATHVAAAAGVDVQYVRVELHSAPTSGGTAVVQPDGAFVYTPALNFAGNDVFRVRGYDTRDGHPFDHVKINVAVAGVNDAPVVGDVMLPNLNEDEVLTFAVADLLAHASDTDNDTLAVTAVESPTANGGAVTIVGGVGTYTPARSWNGADAFTFTVSDGHGGVTTATARLTVVAVNDAPVAGDVLLPGATENAPFAFTAAQLLAHASDVDGDALTVPSVAAASTAGGVVAWDAGAGTGTYTPPNHFHGPDSWTFTVSDGHGGTATATANVDVASVNSAPIVGDVTLAATQEDVPTLFTSLELLAAATDEDGDTPTIVAVAAASANGGSVSYNADAGTGVYTPKADWNGDDTFTFTVGDGNGGLTAGTAHIKVEAARDPPVVRDVNLNDTTEDAPLAFTEADLLSGASDVDVGDTLSVASVAAASVKGGVVTYDVASKTGLFTPARDFNGDDAFTFAVTDGAGTPVSAAARVHVTPAPDAPEAADVVFAAREDTPLTLSEARLLEAARDADAGDVLSIASVATASLHGAVVMRDLGAKTILYSPPANFHGEDEFEFTVADAAGATAAAKFKLNVEPVNDAPVVVTPAAFKTAEDAPLRIAASDLLKGASDVDGDVLTVSAVASPSAKGATVTLDGAFVDYAPALNFNGDDTFTFTVSDGNGGLVTGAATVQVAPVNNAAGLAVAAFEVPKNTYLDLPAGKGVLAGMKDPDGDALTVSKFEAATKAAGRVTIESDGALVYAPPFNFVGPDEASFSFTDGTLETQMVAEITVTADKAPLAKLGLADAVGSLRRAGASCALRELVLRATVSAGRLRMLKKAPGGTAVPTDFGAPDGLEIQIARAGAPWAPTGTGARGAAICTAAFTRKIRPGQSSMQTFESAPLARCIAKTLQYSCGGSGGGALKMRARARAPKGAAYVASDWGADAEFVPACGPCL